MLSKLLLPATESAGTYLALSLFCLFGYLAYLARYREDERRSRR
jgi:hypothetical protein